MEFGEKVKQIREGKGMTQQMLADKLYVTRQAVSRWECGARYPDIITTKKIAEILNISIDELMSGEELKRNTEVENEPVLGTLGSNAMQSILYTIGAVAYGLMFLFCMYPFIPKSGQEQIPAGMFSPISISTMLGYAINFVALIIGIHQSAKNRLTPKRVGILMSMSFVTEVVAFIVLYTEFVVKKNGYISAFSWVNPIFDLIAVVIILWYFGAKQRVTPIPVYLITGWCFAKMLYSIKISMLDWSDIAYVIRSVTYLGMIGLKLLLVYQAYILDKKRKIAICKE